MVRKKIHKSVIITGTKTWAFNQQQTVLLTLILHSLVPFKLEKKKSTKHDLSDKMLQIKHEGLRRVSH